MQPDPKAGLLPAEKLEYNLKCKIKVIRKSYKEEADHGQLHEANMVLLIPDFETSEASRCLYAYLPDIGTLCMSCGYERITPFSDKCPKCASKAIKTEHTEVPAWIAYPVDSPSRLALLRKNSICTQHHFMVMSTGVEDELLNLDGRQIHVRVLSLDQDVITDSARSVNRTRRI